MCRLNRNSFAAGQLGRTRGVAAVELALLLVPLLLIVLGVAEFGRAIHTFNTLGKSVRDAARHLAQYGPGDSAVQGEARCLAVYGRADCTGYPLAVGLTPATVLVCDALTCPATHANQPTGRGVMNLATVTIEGYVFTSVLGITLPGSGVALTNRRFPTISATMRAPL